MWTGKKQGKRSFGSFPRGRRRHGSGDCMKKNRKDDAIDRELRTLAALPDDQIDLSDIPEITEEQFRRGIRGLFYRPVKKPVTIRLDLDIIEWLKKEGRSEE